MKNFIMYSFATQAFIVLCEANDDDGGCVTF